MFSLAMPRYKDLSCKTGQTQHLYTEFPLDICGVRLQALSIQLMVYTPHVRRLLINNTRFLPTEALCTSMKMAHKLEIKLHMLDHVVKIFRSLTHTTDCTVLVVMSKSMYKLATELLSQILGNCSWSHTAPIHKPLHCCSHCAHLHAYAQSS